MNAETQALLFNAVPLLVLAALYLAMGASLLPVLWRERRGTREIGYATALVFPAVGVAAALLGVQTLVTREPLAGHPFAAFAGILIVALPLVAVVRNWDERNLLVTGVRRAHEAEQRSSLRDRELAGIDRLSHRLLDAEGQPEIARLVLDELTELCELDVANLALVENEGRTARILAAREQGRDNESMIGQVVSLEHEPSGVGTVVRDGGGFAVFDAEASPIVSKRLNEIARVKSCAFVPMRVGEEVLGVVFAGVRHSRLFDQAELAFMQTLAAEAGLALQRSGSAAALADALERERLIARISLAVRSRRDLDELLRVAVEETAKAEDVDRCYIRLGEPGERTLVLAEWHSPKVQPLVDASRMPVVNLAWRERRTVTINEVLGAPELADPTLGDVSELTSLGSRAVLATPIIAFGRMIGVLGLHRTAPTEWSPAEISLAEAVAAEAAIAIDTGRLLRDSDRRLAEQRALLKAGRALTSDLRVEVVIDRLVQELRALVDADAVDCWTFAPEGRELVCRAVVGLPESDVGRRIPVQGTIAEAIASGRPVLRREGGPSEQAAGRLRSSRKSSMRRSSPTRRRWGCWASAPTRRVVSTSRTCA